jgi:hypothetical protein
MTIMIGRPDVVGLRIGRRRRSDRRDLETEPQQMEIKHEPR